MILIFFPHLQSTQGNQDEKIQIRIRAAEIVYSNELFIFH
jgi:hypothetical protein